MRQSFVFRAQGYLLRLLSAEGLDAIESVLEPQTFQRVWDKCGKTGGSGFVSFDAVTGEETERLVPEGLLQHGIVTFGSKVGFEKFSVCLHEAARLSEYLEVGMRRAFAEGCEEHIEWSKQVTGYELTENGVKEIFADGTKSIEGSMLVGGEGIYSKVAKQVSGEKLKVYNTAARGIHDQAPTTAFKGLGEGIFRPRDSARSDGAVFLITNVRPGDMDDPNVQFGWTMGGEPGVIGPPNEGYTITGKQAADIAKSLSKNWHPSFKPLFDEMNEWEAAFWKITCSTPSGYLSGPMSLA